MKMCERCFEEYEPEEIYPSEIFKGLEFCIPCHEEYKLRFKLMCIDFINSTSYSDQPERSKREDSHCSNCFELEKVCENSFSQDGFCPECGRIVRCGALNSMET